MVKSNAIADSSFYCFGFAFYSVNKNITLFDFLNQVEKTKRTERGEESILSPY